MSKTTEEIVAALDAIPGGNEADPEGAHGDADRLLQEAVHPDIAAAYERVVKRQRWWACA